MLSHLPRSKHHIIVPSSFPALNRHPSPRHLLDMEDHDMEGAPQHHPELVTYIRQLHLLPPAPGPYQLQKPNATDFSQNGQSRRVASILGGKVRGRRRSETRGGGEGEEEVKEEDTSLEYLGRESKENCGIVGRRGE